MSGKAVKKMFEQAEKKFKVSKTEFNKREPELRQQLLQLQQNLRKQSDFPVIILFAGVDAAGKGETVNLLSEWMDPRWLVTRAYDEPTDEERERPPFWRYWRDLPPRGRIGMFLSAWYSLPILDRVYGKITDAQFENRLRHLINFESTLVDDGALILKFWMHLSRDQQQKRLHKLERDPLLSWRVSERDWDNWRRYDDFIKTAEYVIERSGDKKTPWFIVEGWDHNYRSLKVGETIYDWVQQKMSVKSDAKGHGKHRPAKPAGLQHPTLLKELDLSFSLSKARYKKAQKQYHAELNRWHRLAVERGISTILVFEGVDAAGKGGAIRRITPALDARRYEILPFAAPSDEEKAHHYLWRFWRHLPRAGRFTIFDRSWYGRVLVERVEGFASPQEWQRAYEEINDFEAQLVEHGLIVIKYWLHIDQDEQLQRFTERKNTPHKRWKLTEEDWRNREQWQDYETAVHEMISKTSTPPAPWTLVEANDKHYSRIKVLETLCRKLAEVLQ
jgi:polyphosphate:AMP phosphotransferase